MCVYGMWRCLRALHPDRTPHPINTQQGSTFSVMLDPKGNGNWYSCTTLDLAESGLQPVRKAEARQGRVDRRTLRTYTYAAGR